MNAPKGPPPRESLPDPDSEEPTSVGMAEMERDGTLKMHLRTETGDGTIGEALLVVAPNDKRYADMVRHLGGLKPGEARAIPPFPEPKVDPDSI